MQEIENKIKEYISNFDDANYVSSIFAVAGVPAVIETLKGILAKNDERSTVIAFAFIQDVQLGMFIIIPEETRAEFRRLLPALFPMMGNCVFSENYSIRFEAIVTLGILNDKENIPILVEAFESYKTSDPLLIPQILFSLSDLGFEQWQNLLYEMLIHPNYLFRWSVLKFLNKEQLEALRDDQNKLIQAEASHLCAKILLNEEKLKFSEAEFEEVFRSFNKTEPALTFFIIGRVFHITLSDAKKSNYSLEELELFVKRLRSSTN